MVGVVSAGELEPGHVGEEPRVAGRNGRARRENRVELLELPQADRRADVVEPVVEAEPGVLEPPARVGPALVPEAPQQ